MPVTTLDPATALVVIDLQKGVAGAATAHPVEGVVANAARLASAFREHGLPVVLVNVDGGAGTRSDSSPGGGSRTFPPEFSELLPELEPQAGDIRVTKRTWGAFTGTDLEEQLRAAGVTQLVLAGIATSIGVESTARHAQELGFHVTLATDAMTDRSRENHEHSVTTILPRVGETGTTDEVLAMLTATRA